MAPRNARREAYAAGYENPLIGDIGPLQRLYGTLGAIGAELGGGDMGTPFGQKFTERQNMTKAEVKRLQDLRARYPEEFGQGMMQSADVQDPYMFGLGLGSVGTMRTPTSAGRYTPSPAEAPDRTLMLPPPNMRALPPPPAAPAAPYYRNVPAEMGTSMRPMTPFQQNQVGLSTGRFGMRGYAPEMAVTDFESYAPGGVGRTTSGPTPMNAFDRNMMDAYRRGRMGTGASRTVYGEYTPEEMGSALVPYRQGGLVYEPVGGQGAAPRQVGGPGMSPRLGYERGPIEGEWSEVYGLGGPARPAGGAPSMDFGVTREGMARSPSGMPFNPAVAAGAAGLGYMAGLSRESMMSPSPMGVPMGVGGRTVQLPPIDVFGRGGATALSGQAPGAGTAFEAPATRQTATDKSAGAKGKTAGAKKGKEQGPPMPAAFDPNLNYYVTQALDRLFGGGEAERGRQYQQYYEGQGYY